MRHAAVYIALFAFTVSLITGWSTWNNRWYFDEWLWQQGAEGFAHGPLITPEDGGYGYPATTIFVPASLLIRTGVPTLPALDAVMLIGGALLVMSCALVAYALRPHTPWWAFVTLALAGDVFYRYATAGSVFATLLSSLLLLLVWRAYENRTLASVALAGVCAGVLLATRFETGLVLSGTALLFLRFSRGTPATFFTFLGAATLVFIASDPFFFAEGPWHHLTHMVTKFFVHAEGIMAFGFGTDSYFHEAWGASRAGAPAFLIGLLLISTPHLRSLPRAVIAWFAATTLIAVAVLLVSKHHPFWMFMPFMVPWELLLPFFASTLLALPAVARVTRSYSPAFIWSVLVCLYAFYKLFWYLALY